MQRITIGLQFVKQQLYLRRNFILIYAVFWLLMSGLFAALYPLLEQNSESFNQAVAAFEGTGIAEAFGITADYASSAQAFVGGEQLSIFSMVASGVAVFLGAATIGGAIQTKQIFAFLNKPLSRTAVYTLHYFTNLFTLVVLNGLVTIITWLTYAIFVPDDPFDDGFLLSIFLGFTVINALFLAFGQLFSILIGSMPTILIGIFAAIFGQMLDGISTLKDFPTILKFINPFYYLNTVRIKDSGILESSDMLILVLLTVMLFFLGVVFFRKKEIYL